MATDQLPIKSEQAPAEFTKGPRKLTKALNWFLENVLDLLRVSRALRIIEGTGITVSRTQNGVVVNSAAGPLSLPFAVTLGKKDDVQGVFIRHGWLAYDIYPEIVPIAGMIESEPLFVPMSGEGPVYLEITMIPEFPSVQTVAVKVGEWEGFPKSLGFSLDPESWDGSGEPPHQTFAYLALALVRTVDGKPEVRQLVFSHQILRYVGQYGLPGLYPYAGNGPATAS